LKWPDAKYQNLVVLTTFLIFIYVLYIFYQELLEKEVVLMEKALSIIFYIEQTLTTVLAA
jgi:hypothetical protein